MQNLLKALLIAGLFISANLQAAQIGGIDFNSGNYPPTDVQMTICKTTHLGLYKEYKLTGKKSSWDCTIESNRLFVQAELLYANRNVECKPIVKSTMPTGIMYQPRRPAVLPATGCVDYGSEQAFSISGEIKEWIFEKSCPPSPSGQPAEDEKKSKYTILGYLPNSNTPVCYKPLPPLDCSGLAGLATTGSDSFITNTAGYTQPSCITKCGKDSGGQQQCGNCKVIAKGWIQTTLGGDVKKWYPQVGTLTGAACADDEQDVPPPEPPKCWKSKNNLTMCEQDPAEKCVTINGVQQCEAGCGYVNKQFFCVDKGAQPKPPVNTDNDKPLPNVDDTIQNPEKSINDMVKGDFKEVNKGVESRLAVVSTGIGNLENSVDTSNQILTQIEENTEGALADNQTQIGLLGDIKEALTGEGDGDGECDPEKSPTCATEGDAGAPASWWKSVYPDGVTGIIDAKKAQFQSTSAYESMTQEINIGSGTVQPWQFCFNASAMNFGCFDVEIPSYVLQFVRLCILFGAAILCRRLLIGA